MAKKKRSKKRRASGRKGGRRSSSGSRKRRGGRRGGKRKSSRKRSRGRRRSSAVATLIIGKASKRRIGRSRKVRFKVRNPGPVWAGVPGDATLYAGGVSSGVSTRKKRSGKKRSGKKKSSGKRRGGRRRSSGRKRRSGRKKSSGKRRRRGSRRHRPYMGRVVHLTLKRRKRYAPWRKKRLIKRGFLTRAGRVRNPRRRRNPPAILERAQAFFTSPQTWITGGQLLAGMSAATVGPAAAEGLSKGRVLNHGWTGVGLSGVSTAVAFGAAYYAESLFTDRATGLPPKPLRGLARNVGYGGVALTLLRGLFLAFPKVAEWLKLSEPRTPTLQSFARPMPKGAAGYGDWMELRGMGGMGAVDSNAINEALIAGESFARSVSQFEGMGDWMELRGMGNGNFRVPYGDIRTGVGSYPGQYPGFGDWVEMQPGSQTAMQQWEPAMEAF